MSGRPDSTSGRATPIRCPRIRRRRPTCQRFDAVAEYGLVLPYTLVATYSGGDSGMCAMVRANSGLVEVAGAVPGMARPSRCEPSGSSVRSAPGERHTQGGRASSRLQTRST